MKKSLLYFVFFSICWTNLQAQEKYEYAIIPGKFIFLEEPNQYNLNELAKFLSNKKGFTTYFDSENKPFEFNVAPPCSVLHLNIAEEKAFLSTKLKITVTDCNNNIVAESYGTSKEKDYRIAYNYALRRAFDSLQLPVFVKTESERIEDTAEESFLYAQKTAQGFILLDSENNEVFKLFKTSKPEQFLISNKEINGNLYKAKTPNEWVLEYLKDDNIITDTLKIRF